VARNLFNSWIRRDGTRRVARLLVPLREEQPESARLVEHLDDGRAQPFRDSSGGLLDAVLQERKSNERLAETRQEEQS
jgi:hypothetical protein